MFETPRSRVPNTPESLRERIAKDKSMLAEERQQLETLERQAERNPSAAKTHEISAKRQQVSDLEKRISSEERELKDMNDRQFATEQRTDKLSRGFGNTEQNRQSAQFEGLKFPDDKKKASGETAEYATQLGESKESHSEKAIQTSEKPLQKK